MMNRNTVFVVIGVIGIAIGVFGYWLYQEQHRSGVDIRIGPGGVSIQER